MQVNSNTDDNEIFYGCIKGTFAHVADFLLKDVVTIFVNVGAQKVLEAVVYLQSGSQH